MLDPFLAVQLADLARRANQLLLDTIDFDDSIVPAPLRVRANHIAQDAAVVHVELNRWKKGLDRAKNR